MRGSSVTWLRARSGIGLSLAAALALGGCNQASPGPSGNAVQTASAGVGSAATSGGAGAGCRIAPTINAQLPNDVSSSDQADADCFAWQSFIALNWRADPANPGYPDPKAQPQNFGAPDDAAPKVWETYLEAGAVFAGPLQGAWRAKRPAMKSLARTSKFGAVDLSSIFQAGSGDHWLTNQRGDLTYYEIMVNRDEYEFITQQKGFDLTTAQGQLACAEQRGKQIPEGPPIPTLPYRGGLSMPSGTRNGWTDTDCTGAGKNWGDGVGAMEIKASWTPLPADHSLDYRYKTAIAEISDPVTKTTRKVTVGLVGLHVLRKTIGRQQWVWSTFEQIDNSPDEATNKNGFSPPALPKNPNPIGRFPGFTYFNPACTPESDPTYGCRHNFPPRPCGKGGVCMPYNKPMQITRLNPVGQTANAVTAYVWNQLPQRSVFNYYRLIDVQWPQDVKKIVPSQQRLPLPMGNPKPSGVAGGVGQIVANTTLESFQQKQAACMDCHANYAQIYYKQLKANGPNGLRTISKPTPEGLFASDFSFLFITETRR